MEFAYGFISIHNRPDKDDQNLGWERATMHWGDKGHPIEKGAIGEGERGGVYWDVSYWHLDINPRAFS